MLSDLKDLSEDKPVQAELVQLLSMFEVTFTAKQTQELPVLLSVSFV